jgi:hypothetical protein
MEGRVTEYPWTNKISSNDTIDAWVSFLQRYGSKVFGVELKNEPHNECSLDEFIHWCVVAIQRIEKETSFKGLYFISGVQYTFKDGSFKQLWDGVQGDGQGTHFPSANYGDLKETSELNDNSIPLNRLVFSPHIYADENQDWESNFGFIANQNWTFKGVPIIFSELGGRLEGNDYDFYINFKNWTRENNLTNGMYWYTLPPTSVATGGLMVGEKWDMINTRKMDYIRSFIPNPTI